MGLFNSKQTNNAKSSTGIYERMRPTESARVNGTTIVDLFVNERGSFWGLSRVNETGGRSYRTMKPEQLVDATEAVSFLANVFAQAEDCPLDLQHELSELHRELQAVVQRAKEGFPAVNGETRRAGLLASAA